MFEKVVGLLRACALLFSISFVLIITAFGLVEDSLFFQSDAKSAFIFVSALSCALFGVFGLISLGLVVVAPRLRQNFNSSASYALAVIVLAGLPYFLLAGLDKAFRILGAFRKLDAEFLFFVLWFLLIGASGYLISKLRGKHEIAGRTSLLATIAAPLALIAFVGFLAYGRFSGATAGNERLRAEPRHAVLLVLDGWPAQHLKAFNPKASPKSFDALLDKGLVFRNVRTNAAWTSAYFGALYKGAPHLTYARLGLGQRLQTQIMGTDNNLLLSLQRLGVKTRVMTYHRNGLPEGSSSTVSNYRGLRSVFLTFPHIPYLDALKLEYNLIIPGRGAASVWGDQRKQLVRKLLAEEDAKYDNILTELLLPEMRRLRAQALQSFAIFHLDWKLGDSSLPAAWDDELPSGDMGRVIKQAKARDYRYDPVDEWYAERMRRKRDLISETVGQKIGAFVQALQEQGLLEDTLLMFTADHGSMYAKGRVWYGFHPDEEVLKVPFLMFGAGKVGVDERIFESIDIVQTLIEYYGGSVRLHPRARSMLGEGQKAFTASVTLRSDTNREWFLALYKGDRKYLFNIHPEGDARSLEQTVERFETETVARGPKAVRAVVRELAEVLADYRFADDDIHPSFRSVELRELLRSVD